jgi:hypothetical protein
MSHALTLRNGTSKAGISMEKEVSGLTMALALS